MPERKANESIAVSSFAMTVAGRPLSASIVSAIQQIVVEDELNLPASFSVEFLNRSWFDTDLSVFAPGADVEIKMGVFDLKTVLLGKISSVESSFNDSANVEVAGFDLLYLLQFGTGSVIYEKMSDSDIVIQIARRRGLRPNATNTGAKRNFVYQENISDYEMVLELAERNGYEVFAREKALYFRESAEGKKAAFKFQRGVDLKDFSARMKVLTQDDRVEVRGWDFLKKQPLEGIAVRTDAQTQMGARQNGFQVSGKGFPKSRSTYPTTSVVSPQDATKQAEAIRDKTLMNFIEGSGGVHGKADLRAGVNIELAGFGDRFSGKYYVQATTHTYAVETGYRTTFRARKTGV